MAITEIELIPLDDRSSGGAAVNAALLGPRQALTLSVRNLGKVDPEYIARLCGVSTEDAIDRLSGHIYQNPETWQGDAMQGWELAGGYLSGNVYLKLDAALRARSNSNAHGRFEANIQALKEVLPAAIPFANIYYGLGTPWIKESIYNAFVKEVLFGISGGGRLDLVTYDKAKNKWCIRSKRKLSKSTRGDFGTTYQGCGTLELLEDRMNLKSTVVKHEISDPAAKGGTRRVTDEKATAFTQRQQERLGEAFVTWVGNNEAVQCSIASSFNARFGYMLRKRFSGSYLDFPGLAEGIELFQCQRDAIARILLTPNTLLAHEVGVGKTYTMIVSGMLMRQMGISSKNLYAVPNDIVGQWEDFFRTLYPEAAILVITPDVMVPTLRNETLKEACTGDYDAIIMSHSVFERIPLRRPPKPVERRGSSKKAESCKPYKHVLYWFEDLGVNTLFIDEVHKYKNIPLHSRINNVYGLNITGADTSADVLAKVRCVQKMNGGGGVVLATGTPITNSLADVFAWQSMCQPSLLKMLNIDTFDKWVSTFAERTEEYEITLAGKPRLTTRFRCFCNLPELASLMSQFTDFHRLDMRDDLPKLDKYSEHVVAMNEYQEWVFEDFSGRIEKIRCRQVHPKDDNMLMVYTDARKTSLDVRLFDTAFVSKMECKVQRCARQIYEIYLAGADGLLTQLVFCDTSTPKNSFNIFDELTNELLALGIPRSEIAFVQDNTTTEQYKKALVAEMNSGRVRILVGSTAKGGTGFNVQERLVAIHHLDTPWRPADMIQREGRGLRPGNTNKQLFIYRYLTEKSFDAYQYQILETKQELIAQFMSGSFPFREVEDLGAAVLDYGQVKALLEDNPRIKERLDIANDITRLRLLLKGDEENRLALRSELAAIPAKIAEMDAHLAAASADSLTAAAAPAPLATQEDRKRHGAYILWAAEDIACGERRELGSYRGFGLSIAKEAEGEDLAVYAVLDGQGQYRVKLGESAAGAITRLDNRLSRLAKDIEDMKVDREALINRRDDIANSLGTPESYSSQIKAKQLKLDELDTQIQEGA
ncbi:MAG: hypothetical protein LBI64_03895 [Coriobacteriales bacterium]|nr:hypothetical protein [Coriobacteriales bacterium]